MIISSAFLFTVLLCLTTTTSWANTVRVGVDQTGQNKFSGTIAVVRVHDLALTDADVAALAATNPGAAVKNIAPDYEGDYSLDAWVQPDKDGRLEGRVLDCITPGGVDGFLLDFNAGNLRAISGHHTVTHPVSRKAGEWVHVAVVCDSGVAVLFVDGKPVTPRAGQSTAGIYPSKAPAPAEATTLWWNKPASGWTAAAPLGNGRLGVMAEGGVGKEVLWLNEDTLWSGEPFVPNNPNALAGLPEVRKLLIEGKEDAAHNLFNQKMLGPWNQCYMPLGQLELAFPVSERTENYRRTLDLMTGISTVTYRQDGVEYTREVFVSHPDQAIIVRLTASQPGKISFSATLPSQLRSQVIASNGVLRLTGKCPINACPHYLGSCISYDDAKGMRFEADLQAFADAGKIVAENGALSAKDCDSVTLVLVAATSYNGFNKSPSREGKDPAALCAAYRQAIPPDYAKLRDRHARDFRALMGRVQLNLGTTAAAARPTDRRVRCGFQADDLSALTALYYQFGRYLLVSSSRLGTQPANLQGIWNRSLNPPWSANWTMNCNANFNYLGVEAANLPELHEPFIRLVREWSVDGAHTAQMWYGCKGWVGHHNADLWRNACPVGGNAVWAAFPCGGAWACQDLWEHYAFTLDKDYLRDVWPTLRGAAEFFLDYLIQDPKTGYLVTAPDTNFENAHSRGGGLSMGPTPSSMMVRQLFKNCIAASNVLGVDAGLRARTEQAVAKLPPTQVDAKTGELQEYLDPSLHVTGRGSCELLSTWGLIWCDQLTPRTTPELCAALRKAYEAPDRRPWITGQVGSWQGAFPANTFARLNDGDRVAEILAKHFQGIVQPNFTAGFIQSEWEIDGNLGVMAAIGEMLLQSHAGEIELLPALPKSWLTGRVTGLRARGGFTVDIEWKDGRVTTYRIAAKEMQSVKVRVNGELKTVRSEKL